MAQRDSLKSAEARPKKLWVVVEDADDPAKQYQLIVREPAGWADTFGRGAVHHPAELVDMRRIAHARNPVGRSIGADPCSSGLECLGLDVHRLHEAHGTISGRAYAMYGLTYIEDNENTLAVRDLIAVRFTEFDKTSGNPLPPLGPSDRGQLVATWDQRPIGLLVAGTGYVGFVAPVAEFLNDQNLKLSLYMELDVEFSQELRYLDRTPVLIDAGLDAMTGELNRENGAPAEPPEMWAA